MYHRKHFCGANTKPAGNQSRVDIDQSDEFRRDIGEGGDAEEGVQSLGRNPEDHGDQGEHYKAASSDSEEKMIHDDNMDIISV